VSFTTSQARLFSTGIYQEDGQKAQQYPTDTGRIDILAISKDKKRLLVVELKKGKAPDTAIGQTLRYMGFVKEELAEPDQIVEGHSFGAGPEFPAAAGQISSAR
jgi:hypothetical protein